MVDKLQELVRNFPNKPGVYQFFDIDGRLIYIGKAKDLRKRVSSYFNRVNYENRKLKTLVHKINDIKFIIVNTESDALLLENILIKKHQPKYNILLKDDKTYPWICIKNEPFSRVFITRKYIEDGSLYFGPYTSVKIVRSLMDLVKSLYPLRNCNYQLTENNIQKQKFKPCLEFQLGNCLAPCVGNQTEEDYRNNTENIKKILKGNLSDLIIWLEDEMIKYSQKYEFEKAQLLKLRIELLKKFQTKTTIINPQFKDIEVYTILNKLGTTVVNYLNVNSGVIVQSYNIELKNQLDESLSDLLSFAITEIRNRVKGNSPNILVNIMPEFLVADLKYSIPVRGDKKALVDLSLRNCEAFIDEIKKKEDLLNPQIKQDRILSKIKADLNLSEFPEHIECFDNSNLQGTNAVASCVVFKNLKPAKKEYRHFNIKTVTGPNDFASMQEIVYRRYHKLISENLPLPQLIVIDGGKGQLGAALNSLVQLNLDQKVKIIGIAKRLEEIYFPGDPTPLYLDKRSETLKVIQQIRDEAHRFGITFHKNKRSKNSVKSALTEIEGIGPKTIQVLFTHYKSIQNISTASFDDLSRIVGNKKAEILLKYFGKK